MFDPFTQRCSYCHDTGPHYRVKETGTPACRRCYRLLPVQSVAVPNLSPRGGGQNRKLTNDQVRAIRSRLQKGERARDLAREMKTHESVISSIKHRKSYANVQ